MILQIPGFTMWEIQKKFRYLLPVFLLLVTALLLHGGLSAQPGELDLSFSHDGLVHPSLYEGFNMNGIHILVQSDDKILITGGTQVPNQKNVGILARFLPDGSDDFDFNKTGFSVASVPGIDCWGAESMQLPDNSIMTLVGKNADVEELIALFKWDINGHPDLSFGDQGRISVKLDFPEYGPRSFARQADGKIIICGYAKKLNELFTQILLVRCLPDGSIDMGFGNGGFVLSPFGSGNTAPKHMLLQTDGRIIVAGFGIFDSYESMLVARYMPDGTPDESFGVNGSTTASIPEANSRAYKIGLQPDGKIVLGGFLVSKDGDSDFATARFNPDGSPDLSFGENGFVKIAVTPFADQARSISIQPDGKILLAGFAHSNDAVGPTSALVRLTDTGAPDDSFGYHGIAIHNEIDGNNILASTAIQPDGKIVATGLHNVGNFNKAIVARFITGLTVVTGTSEGMVQACSFYPNPASENITIDYHLDQKEAMEIRLLDNQGRVLQTLLPQTTQESGYHHETYILSKNFVPGTYLISFSNSKRSKAFPVLVN